MKTSNQVKRNTIKLLAFLVVMVAVLAFYPKPAHAAVTVNTVTGSPTLTIGTTGIVTANITASSPSDLTSVTWSTSDASVISVVSAGPNTGTVTAIGSGTATITAMPDQQPGGIPSSITITVPAVSLTGISVAPSSVLVLPGGTTSVTVNFTPTSATNKAVSWVSSNPAVATVHPTTGVITGVSEGTTTITVTSAQGPHQATVSVSVGPSQGVIAVRLDKTSVALQSGSNAQLTATVLPSDASNKLVKWTSSNPSVARVDGTGRVTALSKGTATITATTDDGSYTATCSVTVDQGGSSSTGGKYTVSYSSGSTFKGNGAYKDLGSVSVDGRTLSSNAYSAYAGTGNSTYVKLSDSLLTSLSNGTHTLTMNFIDGSGSTTFAVDRVSNSPNIKWPTTGPTYARPPAAVGGGSTSSNKTNSSKTSSKKGGISVADSKKYIIDEQIDEGVFETVVTK